MINCYRSANPAEALGGGQSEARRLGGMEVQRLGVSTDIVANKMYGHVDFYSISI